MRDADIRATMASAILNAIIDVSAGQPDAPLPIAVDPIAARQALAVAIASILEGDPAIRTAAEIRQASELVAREVRIQLKAQREHHERTGERSWDFQIVPMN